MAIKIIPGIKFWDRQGCLLEVRKRSVIAGDWWCAGVPDAIGLWVYHESDVLKGMVNEASAKN